MKELSPPFGGDGGCLRRYDSLRFLLNRLHTKLHTPQEARCKKHANTDFLKKGKGFESLCLQLLKNDESAENTHFRHFSCFQYC